MVQQATLVYHSRLPCTGFESQSRLMTSWLHLCVDELLEKSCWSLSSEVSPVTSELLLSVRAAVILAH